MKYFFKPYSLFLYVALIAILGLIFVDGQEFDIIIDSRYYTLINRGGLKFFASAFGLIWLIYIWKENRFQSRKLIWIHFAGSVITLAALCYYQVQARGEKLIHVESSWQGKYGHSTHDYFVLPYSGILLFMFVAAQGVFVMQLVKAGMRND